MKIKKITGWGIFASAIIAVLMIMFGFFGHNDVSNWTYVQYPNGDYKIVSKGQWYIKAFGEDFPYPKMIEESFTIEEGDAIRTTFNDGGTADIEAFTRYYTPTGDEKRAIFHEEFGGDREAVNNTVRAHLINCIKATGPLMSATENQASRKNEFTLVVEQQLTHGIYQMKRVERVLKDQIDESGNPTVVFATEIILNEQGEPNIAQQSPLAHYGITIGQYSTLATEYDPQTREQFSAKKKSSLAAEQSKIERNEEVQKRLMIVERGLREKAEVEAIALKEKAQAVIQAQKEKEVAELEASKLFEVAQLTKTTAETAAQQKLEVAKLNRMAADEEAQEILVLASAQEEKILKGGAITEKERVLAEIDAKKAVGVARELAGVKTPHVFFAGGSGNGNSGNIMENMINLRLLESTGILESRNPLPVK